MGPPLEQVDCGSHDSSHMGCLANPNTRHLMAGPKGITARGKRVKDRIQTLLSASMCQELCLVAGTRWQTVSSVFLFLSLDRSPKEQLRVVSLILN